VQCYITTIFLMISDNLPKGKEEGHDNRLQNCTITSADLPKNMFSPSGKRFGLAQKRWCCCAFHEFSPESWWDLHMMRSSLRLSCQRRKKG